MCDLLPRWVLELLQCCCYSVLGISRWDSKIDRNSVNTMGKAFKLSFFCVDSHGHVMQFCNLIFVGMLYNFFSVTFYNFFQVRIQFVTASSFDPLGFLCLGFSGFFRNHSSFGAPFYQRNQLVIFSAENISAFEPVNCCKNSDFARCSVLACSINPSPFYVIPKCQFVLHI